MQLSYPRNVPVLFKSKYFRCHEFFSGTVSGVCADLWWISGSIVMNSGWALLQKPMWCGWNSCKLSICWNHSKLFWADCKNPCAFWYFYVGVQVSWVTSTSWTPRFERIKYDTPFQRHTITKQSYVISCQCWSEKGAKLCNTLSMLKPWSFLKLSSFLNGGCYRALDPDIVIFTRIENAFMICLRSRSSITIQ